MIHKFIALACGCLLFMACGNNEAHLQDEAALKDKLPATLVNNPRSFSPTDSNQLNELGRLQFNDTIHQFGILHEGEIVEYEFAFTNIGKRDILISEAKASCGCTVADYPTHPFKPNATDVIKVTFDSKGKVGMNEKSVLVTTNGNPSVYQLTIQAQVLEK
ncbi:MAG: DUF1573 domain-containing protein [Bacteroidetes bacterium]|nr:DUF1573 domain-containing protein [Bacteroidota bacterium]